MAESNVPDNEIPQPANVVLKATPGQYDWIRMHPSLSSQSISRGSFNSPPPPGLQSANTSTLNYVSPYQSNSRGVAGRSPPPPYSGQITPVTPAISPRLHPSVAQTQSCDSSYQNTFPFNSPSHNPNLWNPLSHMVSPGMHPPSTQRPNRTSSHSNILRRPSNGSLSNNLDPFAASTQPTPPGTTQTQNYASTYQSMSRGLSGNSLPDSSLLESWSLHRAITKAQNNSSSAQDLPRLSSSRLPPDSGYLESLTQPKVEFEALSARQRSLSREASEDAESVDEDRIDDFSSDDEDYHEFRSQLAKAENDVEFFRASQNPGRSGRVKNDIVTRGGYKGSRGPRQAVEPTGDIKARLGQATRAFLDGKYQEAKALATEIIRINAETHEAWTTLASVFLELGNRDKALTAWTYAAHLQPKHVEGWLNCARLFLEETGKRRHNYLSSAFFCYGAALKADSKNIEARLGKAKIYVERNTPAGAVSEYKKVLPLQPRNLELIRDLCAAYYDNSELENATNLYKETFTKFMANPKDYKDALNWSDLDSYIAICQQLDQHEDAIKDLKLVSRWLLGRDSEDFWNDVAHDDREWDADTARRAEVPAFTPDNFPLSTYGDRLPLELRTKMGVSRLELGHHEEALCHFKWLMSSGESGEDNLSNYSDLYRLVADRLQASKLYQHALRFYEPLKRIPQETTGDLYVQMGYCFLGDKLQMQAEECFHAAVQLDEHNIEARIELAKMYESLNEHEQAFIYVNEVMSIRRIQNPAPVKRRRRGGRQAKVDGSPLVQSKEASEQGSDDEEFTAVKYYKYKRHRLADPDGKLEEETTRTELLQIQYHTLRRKYEEMRNGNHEAVHAWMTAARDLTDDFRSVRSFYPYDKYVRFLGYKEKEAGLVADGSLDSELAAMVERLSQHLGADVADKTCIPNVAMPSDYRGIAFSSWLDIFLDFALCLARNGKMKESYEICEAAKDCALWYHSREDLFLIHVCWITCALFACDEESCVNVARFFMRDYQFTTDSYRMFTAVTRTVHSPISWYSSGPSQKYILRQIKAMDFALADEESREKYFAERPSYSALDKNGQLVINDDLDIALLMLYGHILYTGTSYIYALTLDPENPMINLNVGLAYIHHAIKRQAENRQYLILQGLTFLFNYYNSRKISHKLEERQEAHYNMARVYHMLGLTNLAIPYYDSVFMEVEGVGREESREDLLTDTAYNLQSIYAMSGNQELADMITRKWLVI